MDIPEQLTPALTDRYVIQREIGAGGMATVFLADDVRHGRRVAIKVLHPELSAVIGAERFLAEIKTTAALQHPHILPLFDSGSADGLLYYVMPFVEGETLRSRLSREKQLPIADAVRIATEVANALDYAHRRGIIHRDIKPENILLHEGQALVADFGIALAVQSAGGQRMTQTGLSLGTPQYMSPEQAMGEREISARSDVYSLGAVTYEMLAGEPPFTGPTSQSIVAKVITEQPRSLAAQRHSVSPDVDAAVLKALEKLPADRFATPREFADALEGKSARAIPREIVAGRTDHEKRRIAVAAVASGLVMLAVGYGVARMRTAPSSDDDVVRFAFTPPANQRFTNGIPGFGISPDGQAIAYRAIALDGTGLLYVRHLDDVEPRQVKGVKEPANPMFSADGKWIAYWDIGSTTVRKVPVDGGTPVVVANGVSSAGAVWTANDDIIFGAPNAGLSIIPARGGARKAITQLNATRKERAHRNPILLADNKTIIFAVTDSADTTQLAMTTIAGQTPRYLGVPGIQPLGMISGHLIYVTADGQVLAAPFDVGQGRTVGPSTRLLDHIAVSSTRGDIGLSPSGTLVHDAGHGVQLLTIVDERGIKRPVMDSLRAFRYPRLSPDGSRVAVTVVEQALSSVWIYDIPGRTFERVTGPGTAALYPEWTADGKAIVFSGSVARKPGIFRIRLDGQREPEMLVQTTRLIESSLAADGHHLLMGDTARLIYRAIGDDGKTSVPGQGTLVAEHAGAARVSPDGKWIAYQSTVTGVYQIYVRPFPALDAQYPISVEGGQAPVWSRDSRRIVYSTAGRALIAATIATSPSFAVTRRDTLYASQHEYATAHANYDISPDGKRLLIVDANPHGSWMVVQHWDRELKRRLSAR